MEKITLTIPEEIKIEIEEHPEIDWALVFRKAVHNMIERVGMLEFMEEKFRNSVFNEEDAERISEEIKQKRLKKFKLEKII